MPRLAALVLLLLLAACGPAMVEADVTRFTTLPPGGGHSFTILPDSAQRGSLEFQHYAELVAAQLGRRGWQPLPAGNGAAMVVLLHWGAGPPATTLWTDPEPEWYGPGPGPWGPPYGATYAVTVWPKWLEVEVVDGPAWRQGDKRQVWQGKAITGGSQPSIAVAMPALVRALFTGFPGRNGETVRVSVPEDN